MMLQFLLIFLPLLWCIIKMPHGQFPIDCRPGIIAEQVTVEAQCSKSELFITALHIPATTKPPASILHPLSACCLCQMGLLHIVLLHITRPEKIIQPISSFFRAPLRDCN